MELSVVIPTYNRCDLLATTLPRLLEQDISADSYEVIVVSDGSRDGTVELLRQCAFSRVRVIEQENRGQPAARNSGVKAAQGRLILFLDDDLECGASLLRNHVAAHADCDRQIVEGAIAPSLASNEGILARWRGQMMESHYDELRASCDQRFPWQAIRFANTSVPRALMVASGGFDEQMRGAHSELEFGLRISAMGVEYRYLPELAVRHIFRKTGHDIFRVDAPRYGRNMVLLCRKHPGYRRQSFLAGAGAEAWSKVGVCKLSAQWHVPPDSLMDFGQKAIERLQGLAPMRRVATRLLGYRWHAGFFRGAAEAAGSWPALRREFGVRLPVLMYHRVGPWLPGTNPRLTVLPSTFVKQMNWLAHKGYTPIRVSDWIAWCSEGKSLPEKPVVITFDDGYAHLSEYAIPVLRWHGFPATIFVVTSLIGKTNEWDQKAGSAELPLMNMDQIRQAASQGMDFGSHTRTHPDLTQVSAKQLDDEIAGSADDLTAIFGERPVAFAYPFGRHNRSVVETVSERFRVAFTVNESLNSLADDPLLMKRIGISPSDFIFNSRWLLNTGIHPLRRLRDRVRLRTRLRNVRRRAFDSNRTAASFHGESE